MLVKICFSMFLRKIWKKEEKAGKFSIFEFAPNAGQRAHWHKNFSKFAMLHTFFLFFQPFCTTNIEKAYFDQRLEWEAPKCWSKYTTVVYATVYLKSTLGPGHKQWLGIWDCWRRKSLFKDLPISYVKFYSQVATA